MEERLNIKRERELLILALAFRSLAMEENMSRPKQKTREDAWLWILHHGISGSFGYSPTREYCEALREFAHDWIARIAEFESKNFRDEDSDDWGPDEDRLGFGLEPMEEPNC